MRSNLCCRIEPLARDSQGSFTAVLQILFTDGAKDIERLNVPLECNHPMRDTAWDAIHVSRTEYAFLVADMKSGLTSYHHSDLFMRMRMFLHHGPGLKFDEAEHHLLAPHRPNVNSRENGVLCAF